MTRRRLLLISAPVTIVVLVVLVKLWSVVIAGGAVASDFTRRDATALRSDVATLSVLNVIEPDKAFFAAGALAVLDDRLADADKQFSEAVTQADPGRSCPARVDLELVRETMGDRASAAAHADTAVDHYRAALATIAGAPSGCFAGSTDPDAERRALLDSAAARLNAKIDAAAPTAPPPPPPPLPAPASPPPPLPVASATAPAETRRLNPGEGDPLDRLQQILRDAAADPGN